MQPGAEDYLAMLGGSHQPTVAVDAWRAGRLVAQGLHVVGGTVTVTAGGAIRGSLSLQIADETGKLVPTVDGPLSPFGSELNIRAGLRRGRLLRQVFSLGWFVIEEPDSDEAYALVPRRGEPVPVRVSRGAQISLSGADRAIRVQRHELLGITQPTEGTVFAECRRLCVGVVPWVTPDGVTDKVLDPSQVTYGNDRLQALTDLLALVDCDPVVTVQGAMTALRRTPSLDSPVWTLDRGVGGVISTTDRKLTAQGVHNVIAVRTTLFDGSPVIGRASDSTPGIEPSGPFGTVSRTIDSPLAGTLAEANRMAADELAAEQRQRWQTLHIECTPNYALECGDVVKVQMPGGYITGQTTSVTYPLSPAAMALDVAVDPFVLARVA